MGNSNSAYKTDEELNEKLKKEAKLMTPEELDNMRFQIQCLQSGGSLDDQARHRLDQLILEYNNWMYPHLERERKDFAEESAVKFNALKNLDLHKNKFKVDDSVDTSNHLNSQLILNAGRRYPKI